MKRIPITIFLTALVTGLYLSMETCCNSTAKKSNQQQLCQTSQSLIIIDAPCPESLIKQKDSLQTELIQAKKKLHVSKVKINQLQHTVTSMKRKDTLEVLAVKQCSDSLKAQQLWYDGVIDFIDSTNNSTVNELKTLVARKEAQIEVCECSYFELKNTADENLTRERILTEDLKRAYKQQRKALWQQKILSCGMMLLNGIIATVYGNSQK